MGKLFLFLFRVIVLNNIRYGTIKNEAKRVYRFRRNGFAFLHAVNSVGRNTVFKYEFIFRYIFSEQSIKKRFVGNHKYPSHVIKRVAHIFS